VIIEYSQLADIRKKHHDKTIVLGGGSFDLLHYGHVQYIQKLTEYGHIVVVGIKCDIEVVKEKGTKRPIIPEADRLKIIDAIRGVDYSYIVPPNTGIIPPIKNLKPDYYVTTNSRWEHLKELNLTEVIIGPRFCDGHFPSTTSIVKHITATHS